MAKGVNQKLKLLYLMDILFGKDGRKSWDYDE